MHLHHLKTLVIITRPTIRVPIPSLALAIHLPTPMRPCNLEKALPLGLEHRLGRVVEPTVYEVSVETETFADLFQVQHVLATVFQTSPHPNKREKTSNLPPHKPT